MTENTLIRSRRIQTEALSEAVDSLGLTAEMPDTRSQEVEWLIEDYVIASSRLKAAFDRGQRRWTAQPVDDIHEFYTEFLEIVDRQLQLANRVRARALKVSETSLEDVDFKPLDESIQTLLKVKEAVVGLCEWLVAPSQASNGPYLAAEERLAEYEEGEDAGDIYNRLKSGGPLIKE